MKQAAAAAKSIMDDKSLTVAQKSAQLATLETKVKSYSDEISLHTQANMFAGGGSQLGSAAEDYARPRGTSALKSAARDYGWDGVTYGLPGISLGSDEVEVFRKSVETKTPTRVELGLKADLSGTLPPVLSGDWLAFRREPTRISSLFPTIPMPARQIEYLRVNSVTGTATTVAAEGLKPELTPGIDEVTALAVKIAAHAALSDESFQDFPNSSALLEDVISKAVIDAENLQVLSGDGTGSNMTGLAHTSGVLTLTQATGDTPFDTFKKADAAMRAGASYCVPTAYILNPGDWAEMSLIKNTLGNYILGDPGTDTAAFLWGKPVVLTTEVASGTAWAINAEIGGAIGFRRGLSIETTFNSGDDFVHNRTRFRCEERVALAVFRPTAFAELTLTHLNGAA